MYNPLELYKLCCNCIIKEIYDNNHYIFTNNLNRLGLPDDFKELVIDRYLIIKYIINTDTKKNKVVNRPSIIF